MCFRLLSNAPNEGVILDLSWVLWLFVKSDQPPTYRSYPQIIFILLLFLTHRKSLNYQCNTRCKALAWACHHFSLPFGSVIIYLKATKSIHCLIVMLGVTSGHFTVYCCLFYISFPAVKLYCPLKSSEIAGFTKHCIVPLQHQEKINADFFFFFPFQLKTDLYQN